MVQWLPKLLGVHNGFDFIYISYNAYQFIYVLCSGCPELEPDSTSIFTRHCK
jgi:hypothetical protein